MFILFNFATFIDMLHSFPASFFCFFVVDFFLQLQCTEIFLDAGLGYATLCPLYE